MKRALSRTLVMAVAAGLFAAACAPTVSVPDVVSVAAPPAAPLLSTFERVELQSGAQLLLARKADVPLVALSATIRGGAVTDSPAQSGLAALTARLLEKGAGPRDARQFADTVADVGGRLSSSAGLESAVISGEFLSEDTGLMIDLVLDMLMAPSFEPDEFEKLRKRSVESLKAARDGDPRGLVSRYGAAFLFDDHAYGKAVGGLEGTLASLQHEDVVAHHKAHYGGERVIISVVGDIDVAQVREQIRGRLGNWRPAALPAPALKPKRPVAGQRVLLVDKPDATQSYFWMANVGVARDFANEAELDVANTIFGGRFTSMLNTALRVESGLTYGARSSLSRPSQPGSVAISSYTATETTVAAMDLARDTLTKFLNEPPSEALLLSAKNYLRGQTPLDFETAGQMAGQLGSMAFYGRSREAIDRYDSAVAGVDAAGLARVIREVYPSTDELITVVIGKADDIRDDLARYGTVQEISITEPRFAP